MVWRYIQQPADPVAAVHYFFLIFEFAVNVTEVGRFDCRGNDNQKYDHQQTYRDEDNHTVV